MSQQPIETQVVLTTDNSQYDRSMTQSATVTDALASSVDQLGQKLKNVTQSAGRKLIGISAADVAVITGATAAYAAFEKQMTALNAQAAVLNKNYEAGQRLSESYAQSVNKLRSNYGTATREATGLIQTISKMSDQTASVDRMADTFTKMSNATQESATGLASSVLQLQRTMGTPQKDVDKYANSLTVLAANSNTSATAIADFAQQIAPVGKLVGQSQADIQGVSAAFLKSGQDGFRAATVYNKVLTDITYATQSGSPELAKYANFVGMTVGAFKEMSGTEKILSFFNQVNQLGPEAITSLNRMGLDGANTVKAIAAVTSQTGGLGATIAQSRSAMSDNAIDRGSEGAMKGLTDNLAKLRSELTMTAEAFGEKFAPFAEKFVQGLTKMADVANTMINGPFGDLAALFAAILAPLGALGGGALLAAPALTKLAGVALLARGAGTMGLRGGYRGEGMLAAGQGIPGSDRPLSWFQRYQYNTLNRVGAGAAALPGLLPGGFFGDRNAAPMWQRAAAGGMNATAWTMRNVGAAFFSPLMGPHLTRDADSRTGWRYSRGGYYDPAERQRFFNDPRSPWQQARDAYQSRRTGRAYGPSSGQMMVDPGVSLFDKDVRVTDTGRVTSDAAGNVARAAVTREASVMSAAFANVTRASGVLAGSLASAAANTAFLGGKALGKAGMWAANNSMVMGAGALAAGSALGVDNMAFTLGATGMMLGGGIGAAIGGGVGLGIDAVQYNKDVEQSLESLNIQAKETASTGLGLGKMNEEAIQTQKAIDDLNQKFEETNTSKVPWQLDKWVTEPTAKLSGLKNFWEGFFGASDVEELQADQDKAQDSLKKTETVVRDLAKASGTTFTGSRDNQLMQMEEWMSTTGMTRMSRAGITMSDLQKASGNVFTAAFGGMERAIGGEKPLTYDQMIEMIISGETPGSQDLDKRIAGLSNVGHAFSSDRRIARAIENPDNINAQYQAINSTVQGMQKMGLTTTQMIKEMGNIRAEIGDPDDIRYQIAAGAQAQTQRQLGFQMVNMRRGQRFGAQADMFAGQRDVKPGDPQQMQQMMAAEDAMQSAIQEQRQYFVSMLIQQREFNVSQARAQEDFGITRERMDYQYNISRERAQEDFHISRMHQEEDYQRSRHRAEQDFSITQERSQDAYQRSRRRGEFDFQLSRKRQEQDFQHSIELMIEQQAKNMYDVYERVRVESSSSANFLLFNADDQLQRMQRQAQDLDRLRKAGVSDDVIQQLGLTDTKNAQQLSRFVAEVAGNPEMVAEFNKMVRKRLKAAAELTKDESSSEWEEFIRQFNLARERAGEDFERQVNRSHRDFKRQMNEMEEDFRRSMNRQAHDYETAQDRQQEAFSRSMKRGAEDYAVAVDQMTDDFNKSMRRAQQDMNRMAREIGGNLEDVLEKSLNRLGGTGRKQARVVLDALKELDVDASKEGVQIMKHMSRVFGFDYKPPSGGLNWAAGNTNGPGSNPHLPENRAAGGVLNGPRSIGSDNMTFHGKHGTLHLAGGEAVMVPEWVDAVGGPAEVNRMNREARSKKFASGGNIPAAGDWNRHSGYPWARWAGDINIPGSSDYGNPVRAYKPGTVSDVQRWNYSYGNHIRINHPESQEQTLYAHLSRIMVGVLDKVARGEQIGAVGNTGRSYGPHLHFEIKGGTGPVNMSGGGGGTIALDDILKDTYPSVEKAASRVTLGGGLFPKGWWSGRLNKYARQAVKDRMGQGFKFAPDVDAEDFGGDNASNQQIVRNAMRSFGWNQWPSLYQLVMHESGFNNTAQNPTSSAYGMFQFLDSTWAGVGGHKTSDPNLQALYGMRYIRNRYNDPRGAWNFWQNHNWYGDGGIATGAQAVGVAERGPELMLPLNNGGANFLVDLFKKMHVGQEAKMTNVQRSHTPVGHTSVSYQIDRSTTFTGPITVAANDPNEMLSKLRARQRTHALAQQSLGGVRV